MPYPCSTASLKTLTRLFFRRPHRHLPQFDVKTQDLHEPPCALPHRYARANFRELSLSFVEVDADICRVLENEEREGEAADSATAIAP